MSIGPPAPPIISKIRDSPYTCSVRCPLVWRHISWELRGHSFGSLSICRWTHTAVQRDPPWTKQLWVLVDQWRHIEVWPRHQSRTLHPPRGARNTVELWRNITHYWANWYKLSLICCVKATAALRKRRGIRIWLRSKIFNFWVFLSFNVVV